MTNLELSYRWVQAALNPDPNAHALTVLRPNDPLHIGNHAVLYSYKLPIACYSHIAKCFFILPRTHAEATQTTIRHLGYARDAAAVSNRPILSVNYLPYDHLNASAREEVHAANVQHWTKRANKVIATMQRPRLRIHTKHTIARHYLHLATCITAYSHLFQLSHRHYPNVPELHTLISPQLYAQLMLEYGPEDTWDINTPDTDN